jgi:hypothetical protein
MSNGVPPLLNTIANIGNIITLVTSDAILVARKFMAPTWGIYGPTNSSLEQSSEFSANGDMVITGKANKPIQQAIIPDSIVSIDYEKEWVVANYPVEQGQFQSYNKVRMPYHNAVLMTFSGSPKGWGSFIPFVELRNYRGVELKTQLMATLEKMAASLDLYDIVTPERIYENANIMGINYRRSAEEGASLICVEVIFVEVMNTSEPKFTEVKNPNSKPPVNTGNGGSVPRITDVTIVR